ncbi:Phage Hau3 resistance protein [Pseudomonas syringae pv. aptata]|uniref:AAA family ATPase n=1 Tax=Pseudomonas syringae TaxID=317 RepID=UPI000EFEC7C3|nr:AAA family ATPase [Pseudomonas syringae]RMM44332.1 Phage Hau3 resistance protein [Pseudomonas syringae pv. aptata]
MKFIVLPVGASRPLQGKSTIYLTKDNWNDYSFVTMFSMSIHDEAGVLYDIGRTKIGFSGQTTSIATYEKFPESFEWLPDGFFSLGQGVEFYKTMRRLESNFRSAVLKSLRDIVFMPEIIEHIKDESVFSTSLLRNNSLSIVKGQFARVLIGKAELTDYRFSYARPETDDLGPISIDVEVTVDSTPNTNIHAVIGRNGVGKTTLLNGMIDAITGKSSIGGFSGQWGQPIGSDYFSSLVSVSFSAFDPFDPPSEQPDPAKGTCYFYIGLKDAVERGRLRTIPELRVDCVKALISCFQHSAKTSRWLSAIEKLGSDENFSFMKLEQLVSVYLGVRASMSTSEQSDSESFKQEYLEKALPYLSKMSSGHSIVLLTITRLVATVEEKTLVLLDEPESHLHPPLLAAFIRALSDLLHDQNGIALIATHSPVVLQEIPKCCAWIIHRIGKDVITSRPKIETFAENVGVLTSEVFNLEVAQSGFHDLLGKSVASGGTYEEILKKYNGQLGFEGKALLRAFVTTRDRGSQK